METIEKIDVKKMKEDIKKVAADQKNCKNQRRTERLVGERTMTPWEATLKHWENRDWLRGMYAAYGVARGRTFSQIENQYEEENHPLKSYQYRIDKIHKEYTIQVPVEVELDE